MNLMVQYECVCVVCVTVYKHLELITSRAEQPNPIATWSQTRRDFKSPDKIQVSTLTTQAQTSTVLFQNADPVTVGT